MGTEYNSALSLYISRRSDWDPKHVHIDERIAASLENGGYRDKTFGIKVGMLGSSFFAAVTVLHELVHYGRYWNFLGSEYLGNEAGQVFEQWSFGSVQSYGGGTKNAIKYGWSW